MKGSNTLIDVGANSAIIDAYNIMGTNNWQRDYIYYSLTPNNVNGPWNSRSSECLMSMQFINPNAVYPQISTETYDPKIVTTKRNLTDASWTSGSYHFTFTFTINAKNGIGQTIQKSVFLTPDQVWAIRYTQQKKPLCTYYVYSDLTAEIVPLNLFILPFDLANYSTAWKITVEDTRPTQQITYTNTHTSTFAENIEISGAIQKIGLKFGASATQTTTQTHTTVTTLGSVALGDAIITFGDPIVTATGINGGSSLIPYYYYLCSTNDYSTGAVTLSILPMYQY